jgi:hypothetical protein
MTSESPKIFRCPKPSVNKVYHFLNDRKYAALLLELQDHLYHESLKGIVISLQLYKQVIIHFHHTFFRNEVVNQ